MENNTKTGKIYGYARVSTKDQNLDGQMEALKRAGCEEIFAEKGSGAKFDRPEFMRLLRTMQENDTFVVHKLDRASRSLRDLINLLDALTKRKIRFVSISENIDTSTLAGSLLFNILGAIAQFERGLIRERTDAGRVRAKANGVRFGRPFKIGAKEVARALKLQEGGLNIEQIAQALGVSRATLYRRLSEEQETQMKEIFE